MSVNPLGRRELLLAQVGPDARDRQRSYGGVFLGHVHPLLCNFVTVGPFFHFSGALVVLDRSHRLLDLVQNARVPR